MAGFRDARHDGSGVKSRDKVAVNLQSALPLG